MDTKKLETALRTILFEDMSYGVFDRPGPTGETDPEFKPTVPREVPIRPMEMMSTQVATERPPIEDENYRPTSVADLRSAASAIAGLVPADQVENFYMNLQRLLDDATNEEEDRKAVRSIQVQSEEENPEPEQFTTRPAGVKKESHVRNSRATSMTLEQLLSEISRSSRGASRNAPRSAPGRMSLDALLEAIGEPSRRGGPTDAELEAIEAGDEMPVSEHPSEEEMPEPPSSLPDDDDEKNLRAIARFGGYKGPSGARQHIASLLDFVKYQLSEIGSKKFTQFAEEEVVDSFLDSAFENGLIDEEQLVDYKMNPSDVASTDEFRNFFSAVYRPVYDSLRIAAEKGARETIKSLGIPEAVQDTVFNQATGGSARKEETIVKRLEKEGITDPAQIKSILKTIRENFDDIKEEVESIPDTLIDLCREKLENLSSKKMKEILMSAFETSESEREAAKNAEVDNYLKSVQTLKQLAASGDTKYAKYADIEPDYTEIERSLGRSRGTR